MNKLLKIIGLFMILLMLGTTSVSAWYGWGFVPSYGSNYYNSYGGYRGNHYGGYYSRSCTGYYGHYTRCPGNARGIYNDYTRNTALLDYSRDTLYRTYDLAEGNPYIYGFASNSQDFRSFGNEYSFQGYEKSQGLYNINKFKQNDI